MKVILSVDIQGHGKRGDIVEVNEGYARNYLLPKKLAIEATKGIINEYNQKLERERKLIKDEKDRAIELGKTLESTIVTIKVKCGEGKLYGSVTSQDIANALHLLGYDIDKRKVILKDPIKATGLYSADIKLHKEVNTKIKLDIVPDKS
ncbi:MAG: 50S ribosomal protein L9 [Christensenellaceae bacterium]|jgi:large subunit ribosomal protein L9|nr:50S ribosomal protein L9 [Christensenellaceae bacterium]